MVLSMGSVAHRDVEFSCSRLAVPAFSEKDFQEEPQELQK
jgi:hypothetical protein